MSMWVNRLGRVAQATNPQGGKPQYGLILDTATAQWASLNFNAFVNDVVHLAGVGATQVAPDDDETFWDQTKSFASDFGSSVYGAIGDAIGAEAEGDDRVERGRNLARQNLGRMGRQTNEFLVENRLDDDLETLDKMWRGVELAPTALRRATLEDLEDDGDLGMNPSELFARDTWAQAWQDTENISLGQSVMDVIALGDGVSPEQLDELKKHDTFYNLASGGMDVLAAWKIAPEVVTARGLGTVRAYRRGQIPMEKRTKRGSATTKFRNATIAAATGQQVDVGASISRAAGRVYGENLAQRAEKMRSAARNMQFERFANLYAFRSAPNGASLAATFKAAADDDNLWDLTLRASLGDARAGQEINALATMAPDELKAIAPSAATFVDALQAGNRHIKALDDEIVSIESDLLARQATGKDATSGYYRYNTWLLETDLAKRQAQLTEAQNLMARYEKYDHWLELSTANAVGGPLNAISHKGSFFANKDSRFFHFQDSQYGKRHTVARVARAPWLKKPGVVDLHHSQPGYQAVRSYFDQLEVVAGQRLTETRARLLEQYANLTTDVQRRTFMEELERGVAVEALAAKHKVHPQVIFDVIDKTATKRDHIIGDMATNSKGGLYTYVNETGDLDTVELPVDPTQLQNYYMTLDLQELDSAIKRDSDFLHEADTYLQHHGREAYAQMMNGADSAGRLFNHLWKPLVLLRLGWTTRVIPDEMMRVMAQVAAVPFMTNLMRSVGVGATNVALAGPRRWYNGKKYRVGGVAEKDEIGVVGAHLDVDDPLTEVKPTPMDLLLDAAPVNGRMDRIMGKASERQQHAQQWYSFLAYDRLVNLGRNDAPDTFGGRMSLSPEGEFFHGSAHRFKTGEVITPASKRGQSDVDIHFPGLGDPDVAYATPEIDIASWFSDAAVRSEAGTALVHNADELSPLELNQELARAAAGKGHVYRVIPEKGPRTVRDDPNMLGTAVVTPGGFRVRERLRRDNSPPAEQPWSARLNREATRAQNNGENFVYDPASDLVTRKGYSVPVFAERTLSVPASGQYPFMADVHVPYFAQKNADVLSLRGMRVEVSYDQAAHAYQLRVVRHFAKRNLQKAMEFGARVEADELVDMDGGWSRLHPEVDPFADSDLLMASDNALLAPADGPMPRVSVSGETFNPAEAQAKIDLHARVGEEAAERQGVLLGAADEVRGFFRKREIGKNKVKWRSEDGKRVEVGGIYDDEGRMYMTSVSSSPTWRNLLSGYDKSVDVMRRTRAGFQTYDPPPMGEGNMRDFVNMPAAHIKARNRYYKAWRTFVNDHVRYSPIWRQMLAGKTDDEIVEWLRTSRKGRELRKRLPWQGYNPRKWVSQHRQMLDEYMPSVELQRIAAERDVEIQDLVQRVAVDDRPSVRVPDIDAVDGGPYSRIFNRFITRMYNFLGTLPTDRLVRHPFANTMYQMKMRNFVAQNPSDTLTDEVLRQAQKQAREFALAQVQRTLFNLADDTNFIHFYRFIMPFTNAWQETMVRWARIGSDHPESIARLILAWDYLNDASFLDVEEGEGGLRIEAGEYQYGSEDRITAAIPEWLKSGLKKAGIDGLDHIDRVSWTKGSMNLILQGEYPFVPGASPIVSMPVDWGLRLRKDKGFPLGNNKGVEGWVYKWLFPLGRPEPGVRGAADAVAPAWMRNVREWLSGPDGDAFYNRQLINIANAMQTDWELGRRDTKPTMKEALEATESFMFLRAMTRFGSPVGLTYHTPYQFYVDKANEYEQKFGYDRGYTKFVREFGGEYAKFAESLSQSESGIPATEKGYKQSLKFQDIIAKYPEFGSMIVSPQAYQDEFDYDIYENQFHQPLGPGSDRKHRSRQSFHEYQVAWQERYGWWKYTAWRTAVDAELVNRGLTSLNSSGAEDLALANNQFINTLADELPGWEVAYAERPAGIGSRVKALREIAFDRRMESRPDMQGLRQYLRRRDQYATALNARYAAGGSRNLQAGENADLKAGWDYEVAQMKERNPMFADLYNRWLENDTMETGGGL